MLMVVLFIGVCCNNGVIVDMRDVDYSGDVDGVFIDGCSVDSGILVGCL